MDFPLYWFQMDSCHFLWPVRQAPFRETPFKKDSNDTYLFPPSHIHCPSAARRYPPPACPWWSGWCFCWYFLWLAWLPSAPLCCTPLGHQGWQLRSRERWNGLWERNKKEKIRNNHPHMQPDYQPAVFLQRPEGALKKFIHFYAVASASFLKGWGLLHVSWCVFLLLFFFKKLGVIKPLEPCKVLLQHITRAQKQS